MDELYRSKTIKLMEEGIQAAGALESHLKDEQLALVSQDALALEGMVVEKRTVIERLAMFETEILDLLRATKESAASDNWVEIIRGTYPDDHRIEQTVEALRARISACHHLTVENEGLVNIGLARVSMALEMLSDEAADNRLYAPRGEGKKSIRGSRSIAHI